jgi:hypothetical protein
MEKARKEIDGIERWFEWEKGKQEEGYAGEVY